MKVSFHSNFKKKYKKLPSSTQARYDEKLKLFMVNQFDPTLNNHPLSGRWKGYRSINVTGDLRALFEIISTVVLFVDIDTHSNLYR